MVINSITGTGGLQQAQAVRNASEKLQAVIASIVKGTIEGDVAKLSVAAQLQSQTAGLRQVSGNLAQGLSQTQVAEGGVEQIQGALRELQSIAQQASNPVLNDANRQQLNEQFKKVVETIDKIAGSTSFNNKPLLDGSVSGDDALSLDALLGNPDGGSADLTISSLSSSALFDGNAIDVLSADNAGQALTAINEALNRVISTRADIGAFQQTLNFASANVDTAIINQEAAQAALSETDLAEASANAAQADVQREAAIALQAQGNRLSPALLKLVG